MNYVGRFLIERSLLLALKEKWRSKECQSIDLRVYALPMLALRALKLMDLFMGHCDARFRLILSVLSVTFTPHKSDQT